MPRTRHGRARPRLPSRWRAAERKVASLADRLGRPVDPKIVPAVVALRAHGFETTASCQGHLAYGDPAPSVDVGVFRLTPQEREAPSKAAKARLRRRLLRNLKAQQRLLLLLGAFYGEHAADAATRLVLQPFGVFGGFTITNQGAAVQPVQPPKRRRARLLDFQREFRSLAEFLESSRT